MKLTKSSSYHAPRTPYSLLVLVWFRFRYEMKKKKKHEEKDAKFMLAWWYFKVVINCLFAASKSRTAHCYCTLSRGVSAREIRERNQSRVNCLKSVLLQRRNSHLSSCRVLCHFFLYLLRYCPPLGVFIMKECDIIKKCYTDVFDEKKKINYLSFESHLLISLLIRMDAPSRRDTAQPGTSFNHNRNKQQ